MQKVATRGLAVIGLLLGVLWCALGHAAPPDGKGLPGVDSSGDTKLPPPPTADSGEPEVPIELSDEEKLAQRQRDFDDRLSKAEFARERGRLDEAVREYSAALRVIPREPTALLGRAYARKERLADGGCPRKAISDLLWLAKEDPKGAWVDERNTVIEWMALCGSRYASRQLVLAKELADEKPGSPGRPDDIRAKVASLLAARAQGEDDPAEAKELKDAALSELLAYDQECAETERHPIPVALRLLADMYREADDLARAASAYDRLLALYPKSPQAKDAADIRQEVAFELELRRLDATVGFRPTEEAEAAYNRGLEAFRAADLVTAESELTWAIDDSPWFPRAYYWRGVVLARTGHFQQAVDDLKRATRMDRSDYRAHMTLGMIYKKEFAGAEDDEAIKHLSAALRLRPDLARLHLLLGELYARTDSEKAREHFERLVVMVPIDDPDARLARQRLVELEREIRKDEPPPIPGPGEESLRFLDPELQRLINEAYLRGTEHQDWDEAEKILLEARDRFPREPIVLNELARVFYHQDRHGEARRYWEESLAMKEDQVEVHERLGLLLQEKLPDDAVPHLSRAAELGSPTARYLLAELLWEQNQFLNASDQLDRYLKEASDYDLHWERAQALRTEIDRRFLQFYLVGSVFLTFIIVIPAWRIYRHYRGASLRQLLERDPKSFPEVARILSLIRHEILKHNTAFLADVGRALEFDAADAEHRAEVLSRRMFGETDDASGRRDHERESLDDASGPAGIHGRFLGYVGELEKVARAHRVTLNLHRKDPIFRPMISAFDELARWTPQLRNPHRLKPSRKLELAKVLRKSGHVLGRQAFERLSELIRELCVTAVDANIVRKVYDQIAGEKQFATSELAPLSVRGAGAPVRIFRTDLEDILANVFRNSLRSSLQYAVPPVGLGIDLVTEVDEITGLGSIAIRIKDRSPEQLSNEMLRGRYVERGMGITVDLLSRYDGAIGVEPEPGWSKAVVLRFFILEDETTTLDAEAAQ